MRDARLLLAFAFCVAGGAFLICYASVGPDQWVVFSNAAFLVPAFAAWMRYRRWFVLALLLVAGAASVTYHVYAVSQSNSDAESNTLRDLQRVDHIAAVYTTVVVATLPFLPTRDSRSANAIALASALGPTGVVVWYTVETDFETISSVALTLGTLLFSHWMQLVIAVWRLGEDWRLAQTWNLAGQAVPPVVTVLLVVFVARAWDPYTIASIVGVALLWPFIMQSILAQHSGQWRYTSVGLTLNQFHLYPVQAWAFIVVLLLLSLGALALLLNPHTTDDWGWHGLWHVLAATSATFVIWNSPSPSQEVLYQVVSQSK
jgi:hypothetical protein